MKSPGSWKSRLVIGLALAVTLTLVVVVVAQVTARGWVRRSFERLPGYANTYEVARVGLFPPAIVITHVRLLPEAPSLPILVADEVRVAFRYRDLLRLRARPRLTIERAKVTVFARGLAAHAPLELPEPFAFETLHLLEGELLLVLEDHRGDDPKLPAGTAPVLWLHGLEATLDGTTPLVTTLRLDGKVAATGTLSMRVTADVTVIDGPHFTGEASVNGLVLGDLYAILEHAGARANGTLDLSARVGVNKRAVTGDVRELVKDGAFKAVRPEAVERLRVLLIDGAAPLVSGHGKDRRVAGAAVPFMGTLADPVAETWTTALAVFRNAFALGLVEAVGEGRAGK